MSLVLVPGTVRLSVLECIYRESLPVRLDPVSHQAINRSCDVIAQAVSHGAPIYGVNTGFGKLANRRIDPKDTCALQRNLILSHCSGVGAALPVPVARLIMTLKLISLGRGMSGARMDIIRQLEAMLAHDVVPVIPGQGSVGASGDLAPLAHMAAVMIGEGYAEFQGREMPGGQALAAAGLQPVVLGPKEGLALINGTQVSTALALVALFDTWRTLRAGLITGALSSDAAMASSAPFHPEIHACRGHQGQIDAAKTLRAIMAGSQIRESHRDDDERVQDPYCIRCQPQVMGACIDLLRHCAKTLEIEANAVTDNPLVFEDGSILSGGNFHAEPVAFTADQIAIAIAEIGSITQRRIALLVDPALSFGLPAFLTPKPGLNSGFMIAEVTSAALMSENKALANPRSVDSTPTSANQEDHVSMACHGARRLLEMVANLQRIVAIEALVAAQGVELRAPLATSQTLQEVIAAIRIVSPALAEDRFVATDIEAVNNLVRSNQLASVVGETLLPVLGEQK